MVLFYFDDSLNYVYNIQNKKKTKLVNVLYCEIIKCKRLLNMLPREKKKKVFKRVIQLKL